VGDLDLAPWHTLHYDTQFTENGQVFQVTEVQCVDAQARRSKTLLLFAACVERWRGGGRKGGGGGREVVEEGREVRYLIGRSTDKCCSKSDAT